jgi:hypothetical protein
MDTSGLMSELPKWLPWASLAVNVAYSLLGVVTIVVASCLVAQIVKSESRPATTRRKTTPAH